MSASVKKMRKVQFVELIEFVTVTEYHSFTRAAAQLGVSSAALSQSIRAAEERLGLRLLNRTTRHVAPTPAGECLLERLRVVLKDLDSALEELNEDRDTPAGYLRLAIAPTTTHVLGPGPLCGALSRNQDRGLGRRWPVDIVSGHFDASIQLGAHVAHSMIAMRVSDEIQRIVVGAPTYFGRRSPPRAPEELSGHNCIRLKTPSGGIDPWQFVRGGKEFGVPVDGTIILNDVELALRTALSGGGLLYLPESYVKPAIAAGALRMVLQAWMPKPSDGFVLCYPSRRQNPALRCLADFLRQNLRRERLDIDASAEPPLLRA